MTDADHDTDHALDDLKEEIARSRRNSFLINLSGVVIAAAAIVIAGYYSLGEVSKAEHQVGIVEKARDEAKTAAEEAKAKVTEVSDQLELAEREVASLSDQIAQIEPGDGTRIAALKAELADAEAARAALTQQAEGLKDQAQALAAGLDKAQIEVREAEAQRNQLMSEVVKLESNVEIARREVEAVAAERNNITAELSQTRKAFAEADAERSKLAANLTALQSRNVVPRDQYEKVTAERDRLGREVGNLRRSAANVQQSLETAQSWLAQAERKNKTLERRITVLSARSNETSNAQVKALENRILILERENRALKQRPALRPLGPVQ